MKYSKYISLISGSGDLLILNICFNLVFCYIKGFDASCFSMVSITFFFYINVAWLISANIFKAYKIDHQLYKKAILLTYIKTIVFFFFMFLMFFQIFIFNYYSRNEIKILFAIFFAVLIIWRYFLYYVFHFYRKKGYNFRNVVIVGYNETATTLKSYFTDNIWTGYRFKGFFTYTKLDEEGVLGTYDDLEKFIVENSVDELYILINDIHKSVYKVINEIVSKHPVKIRLVPDLSDFSFMSIRLVDYDMVPVMQIQQGPLSYWYNRLVKRLFDVVFSFLVIVLVLSWLIPLIWIIDLLTDRQGVFFVQRRSGLNNKEFNLIKFRTMKKNNEAHTKQATAADCRITKFGSILRKTSIDEMPQFFNVFVGNMSVIGPRPHMLMHTDEFKAIVNRFMIRHAVKPGITGYAQVRGFRGEIKEPGDIEERIKMDISYIENWTAAFDMKIAFLTVGLLLKGDKKAY